MLYRMVLSFIVFWWLDGVVDVVLCVGVILG